MATMWERVLDADVVRAMYGRMISEWLPSAVAAILTLAAVWVAHLLLMRLLQAVSRRSRLDATLVNFLRQTSRMGFLAIGVIAALGQLGINTASFLTSLGVAGLTIGFAARDALSNVIAGLFIFWDRPFTIGDLIEVSGRYGRVDEITMRSTRVVTTDGKMLAIPNTEIVNTTVASYTNFPHLRIDIPVTIGTGEDLGRVRRVLLGLVEGDEAFLTEPAAAVVVTALGDYNTTVELRVWLADERTHVSARDALRERAFEALRTHQVEMPCETLRLEPITLTSA